jgi:hypothetical protein
VFLGARFAEASMDGKGFDRVRRTEIGRKHFKLTHFEEVFDCAHRSRKCFNAHGIVLSQLPVLKTCVSFY